MLSYLEKLQEFVEFFEFMDECFECIQVFIDMVDCFVEVFVEIVQCLFDEICKVFVCEFEVFVWVVLCLDGMFDFYFVVENFQGILVKVMVIILSEIVSGVLFDQVVEILEDVLMIFFGCELLMGKNMGFMVMIVIVCIEVKRVFV